VQVALWFSKTAWFLPYSAALAGLRTVGAAATLVDRTAIPLGLGYGAYKAARYIDRRYPSERDMASYFGMDIDGSTKRSKRGASSAASRRSSASGPKRRTYKPASRSSSTGHYQGRLKRPRRSKAPGSYDKHGYSAEVERYGTQNLTGEVCYLGATSYCRPDLGPVVGVALLRKLLKRHYMFEYSHPAQQILSTTSATFANVGPVGIRFYYESNAAGGGAAPSISTIASSAAFIWFDTSAVSPPQTLQDFGTWFNTNVLSSADFGGQPETMDNYRIHGYQFIERDYTVSAADPGGAPLGRTTPIRPLKGQYLTAYSYVTMGIQNATPADDGSLSTTHVTTNPIKGKLFRFKDMVPRLRQRRGVEGTTADENAHQLCMDPNQDGIIKPGSVLVGGWVQIPQASMFDNCSGEASISLEPGAIKDYSFGFKYNGTLEKFIKGNRSGGFFTYDPMFKNGGFGTSCLFALEKRMPTGAASPTINFHYESKFGCKFGRTATVCMQRGATGQAVVSVA